ncbi:MAG: hypothetical protein WCO28_08330 [Bacteroidota bacterium]
MNYLLKVNNETKAKSLFQFLKNLDFVEIEKHDATKEWAEIVKTAERSKSVSIIEAKGVRETWKKKLKS